MCLHQAQPSSIHANGVNLFGVVFTFSFHFFATGNRLIAKAISKGEYGGSIIYTDVGSDLRLTEQNLTRAEHTANKSLPSWLLPYLSNTELARASRPDIILVLPTGSNHTPHVHVQDLPPST